MTERIRILVADDSPTLRAALTALLEADPRLSVVGEARDGVEAVRQAVELHPDVVTMDVLMPRQDGLGAIQEIMDRAPTRILVVSSVADDLQLNLSFRAISLGALEVISKPSTERPEDLRAWGRRVADAVSLMAEVPVVRRRRGVSTSPLPSARRARVPAVLEHDAKVSAFGIVASTGGPPALAKLLAKLPQDLPIPVLVAQHMAPGFGRGLAHWLYQVSGPRVIVALHGAPVLPGAVYLPPDGMDLEVGPHQDLRVTPASGRHVPSGDRLLDSLARVYGSRAGGAVLTGMGDDGALGLLEIRRRGGVTMAQEEEDCVVFGMPRAARAAGATDRLVSALAIARAIVAASGARSASSQPPAEEEP